MTDVFRLLMAQHEIPIDDFPEITKFKENLNYQDFSTFPTLENEITMLDNCLFGVKGISTSMARGTDGEDWALQDYADSLYDSFLALGPEGGFLSRTVSINVLMESGLGRTQMGQIWTLADMDQSGCFDLHEFVVAKYLCDEAKKGNPVPKELPANLVPPFK